MTSFLIGAGFFFCIFVITVIVIGVINNGFQTEWMRKKAECKKEFERRKKLKEIKDAFGYPSDAEPYDPVLICKIDKDRYDFAYSKVMELKIEVEKLKKKLNKKAKR